MLKKIVYLLIGTTSVYCAQLNFNNIGPNLNTWLNSNSLGSEFYGHSVSTIKNNQLCLTITPDDGNGNTHKKDGRQRQEIKSLLDSKWTRNVQTQLPIVYQVEYKLQKPFDANVDRFFHIFQIKFQKTSKSGGDGGTPLFTIGFLQNKFGIYIKSDVHTYQKFYPITDVRNVEMLWLTSIIMIDKNSIQYTVTSKYDTYKLIKPINIDSWSIKNQYKLRFKFGLYRQHGSKDSICYRNIIVN